MARAVEITDQGSFIPASQRPDGSWRKPRRVRDGYVPQEEVPLYESKGKQWANNQSRHYPVGLDPSLIKAKEEAKAASARSPIPGLVIENDAKKKKKKKKNSENGIGEQSVFKDVKIVSSNMEKDDEWQTVQSKGAKAAKVEPAQQANASAATDPAKRLKNLKKKLREIEVVELKITSGEIKKPDKDQVEKVNRKADILSEIFSLELTVEH